MLKVMKNPSKETYEIRTIAPELTFLGVKNQPDFAELEVTMYPNEKVIELKSFKLYLQTFRNKIISYEHLINTIYEDLMQTYEPEKLVVIMKTQPRGGISSVLKVDSSYRKNKELKKALKKQNKIMDKWADDVARQARKL